MIDDLACSIYSAFYHHFYQLGASFVQKRPPALLNPLS